jgi:glutamate-ammonia-ligase adenylyltransferase
MPRDPEGRRILAIRLGYLPASPWEDRIGPAQRLQADYRAKTDLNRRILDHLLHDAFPEEARTEPEIDLVNDPDPSPETIERVLGRYSFRDVHVAYDNLMSLANETIPFLSARRSRLFLAAIAPRLLSAIERTPDPDATLVTLSRVSDSLGGKAALWELFRGNPPTLQLYVKLCAACPYLAGTLTSNPGMIDELMDSLIVERLPDLPRLEASLRELTRGAEDLEPILLSFKNVQHLRVGVRDLVGKDDIQATHAALSDVAEACLKQIAAAEQTKLIEKLGQPTIGPQPESADGARPAWAPDAGRAGQPSELIVLALGKLGGREPNYHSDLDLVFLYEAEGATLPGRRGASTSNSHFFSELGQRIIKAATQFGPHGRLYEIDPRLRPTGRSGALAMPLSSFVRYFEGGEGQLWERLALCKARVIIGSPEVAARAMAAVTAAVDCRPWSPQNADEIREMRQRLRESASPQNLKRAAGGTMDVEFIVQMLQLKFGRQLPQIRVPGTLAALEALATAGLLNSDDAEFLASSYRFQRSVEARIRLMDAAGRHELPDEPRELAKLAYLLGYDEPDALAAKVDATWRETRARFDRIFAAAAEG